MPGGERTLGAVLAVTILCGYVVAQVLGGALVGVFAGLGHAASGTPATPEELRALAGPAALVGMLCGAVFLWFALRAIGRERLGDTSERGIAWARGSDAALWFGVGAGALVAVAAFQIALVWFPPEPGMPLGPMAELTSMPGPGRLYVLAIALALAPVLEELLFRGVLLAGLTTSWGRLPAAGLTTLGFIALHANELRFYPAAAVGIVALALLALWLRVRFRALGPAIAAHFSYNAVLVAAAALSG